MKMYLVDTFFMNDELNTAKDEKTINDEIKCPVTISNVISFTPVDVEQAKAWVQGNKADEVKQDVKYKLAKMFRQLDEECDIASLEQYLKTEQPCDVLDVIHRYPDISFVMASCFEDVEL